MKKDKEAAELHDFLKTLSENTIGKFGVAGVKFGMELRGFFGGKLRLPLLPLKYSDKKQIVEYFQKSGINRFNSKDLVNEKRCMINGSNIY